MARAFDAQDPDGRRLRQLTFKLVAALTRWHFTAEVSLFPETPKINR